MKQEVIIKKIKGEKIEFKNFEQIDNSGVEKYLKELVTKNPNAPLGGLVGDTMKHFKGKADGKIVMQILKKLKLILINNYLRKRFMNLNHFHKRNISMCNPINTLQ